MLTLLVVLAVAGILFLAAVVATQDSEVLVDAPPDGPDVELPPGRLVAEDLRAVRFAMVFRGYRMSEVDEVLDRLGEEIAGRDERIAHLERVLAEIVAPAVDEAEAQQAATSVDAASSVDAATEGWAAPVPEGEAPDHDADLTPLAPSVRAPGLDLPTGPAAVALPGSPQDVTSFRLPPAADEPGRPSYDELAEPFGAEMLVEDPESADRPEPAPADERDDTATASGEAEAIEGSDEAVAAELAAELAWPGPVDDSTDVTDVTDLTGPTDSPYWAAAPEPVEGAARGDAGVATDDEGGPARTEWPLTPSAEESSADVGHPFAVPPRDREPEGATPDLTGAPTAPPTPSPWSSEGGLAAEPSAPEPPETDSGDGVPSGEAERSAVPGTGHLEDDVLFPEVQASEPAAPDALEATEDEGPATPTPRAEE